MSSVTTGDDFPVVADDLPVRLDRRSAPHPHTLHRPRLGWARRSWKLEVASVVAFDALYESVRALAPAHVSLAFTNAHKIMSIEASTHLDVELSLNRFLTGHPLLGSWSCYYYSSLFFALTPLLLVWLWARRPDSYARLRSALVLSTFVALVGYWMFPVAPPRFALPGATDTMVSLNIFGAASPHTIAGLINNYAAMPSLHVAWATWVAVALVMTGKSPWRHMAWLYPAVTTLVVLATANHYLLDAIVGAALIYAGVFATRARVLALP